MNLKRMIFSFVLTFNVTAYAQILENTFADGDNVIIGQKNKKNVEFVFSKENAQNPYCVLPFKLEKGKIILPEEHPARCKYISESDKKLSINLDKQFDENKFDGVFLFQAKDAQKLYTCFRNYEKDQNLGYGYYNAEQATQMLNQFCKGNLGEIHTLALKKKRKIKNKSVNELYAKHIDASDRSDSKEDSDLFPLSPYGSGMGGMGMGLGGGLQFGSGGFGY
jgi:hypothetical protein